MSEMIEDAPLSIAQHAAQFGPESMNEKLESAVARETTDEPPPVPVDGAVAIAEPAAEPEQKGRRHRAKSQQAGPEDVPRIKELTARAKAAEEEREALRAEVASLKSRPAQPREPPRQAPPAPASDDRGPQESEVGSKYDTYGDYIDARAEWRANKVYEQRQEQAAAQSRAQAWKSSWDSRWDASKTKYPDFETAVNIELPIPVGSTIDQFIREDDNGHDLLYHLARNRGELDALNAMPPVAQAKAVALLVQRLASASPAQAGTTGAVASVKPYQPPPRPPTPVRTEAQRVSGTPPPSDGTLSMAEHRKAFYKAR